MGLTREQKDWLTLVLIPGVGAVNFMRLLARFRSASGVLHAGEAALAEVAGPKLAERIHQYSSCADVEEQERLITQYSTQVITLEDAAYPPRLAEIYDPPLALFVRGELREEDELSVAIVGTRRASPYGLRMAERLARELAERGVTVVSGMASGIDAAAHRGAMAAGGRTIAVLGCGVDVVYPSENRDLMEQIIGHGCVLSQFPMGTKPNRGHFPYRNRIISGLTMGVIVIEAPVESGSLITARHAAEQGREVFAVPGPVGSPNSAGPHSLIRQGAKLVETAEDILAELAVPEELLKERKPAPIAPPRQQAVEKPMPVAPPPPPVAVKPKPVAQAPVPVPVPPPAPAPPPRPPVKMSEGEAMIFRMLKAEGTYVDEIAAQCRIPVSQALSTLTMLELKGLIRQYSGKRFAPA